MERIIVQLEPRDLHDLDALAAERSSSRSALVRQAIAMLLAERRRRLELEAVVASYASEPAENLVPKRAAQRRAWPG